MCAIAGTAVSRDKMVEKYLFYVVNWLEDMLNSNWIEDYFYISKTLRLKNVDIRVACSHTAAQSNGTFSSIPFPFCANNKSSTEINMSTVSVFDKIRRQEMGHMRNTSLFRWS